MVDIYRVAKRRGRYLTLATNTEVNIFLKYILKQWDNKVQKYEFNSFPLTTAIVSSINPVRIAWSWKAKDIRILSSQSECTWNAIHFVSLHLYEMLIHLISFASKTSGISMFSLRRSRKVLKTVEIWKIGINSVRYVHERLKTICDKQQGKTNLHKKILKVGIFHQILPLAHTMIVRAICWRADKIINTQDVRIDYAHHASWVDFLTRCKTPLRLLLHQVLVSLWRRANTRNVGFINSLPTKLSCYTPYWHSTTVCREAYPFIHLFVWIGNKVALFPFLCVWTSSLKPWFDTQNCYFKWLDTSW